MLVQTFHGLKIHVEYAMAILQKKIINDDNNDDGWILFSLRIFRVQSYSHFITDVFESANRCALVIISLFPIIDEHFFSHGFLYSALRTLHYLWNVTNEFIREILKEFFRHPIGQRSDYYDGPISGI